MCSQRSFSCIKLIKSYFFLGAGCCIYLPIRCQINTYYYPRTCKPCVDKIHQRLWYDVSHLPQKIPCFRIFAFFIGKLNSWSADVRWCIPNWLMEWKGCDRIKINDLFGDLRNAFGCNVIWVWPQSTFPRIYRLSFFLEGSRLKLLVDLLEQSSF